MFICPVSVSELTTVIVCRSHQHPFFFVFISFFFPPDVYLRVASNIPFWNQNNTRMQTTRETLLLYLCNVAVDHGKHHYRYALHEE